MEPLSITNTGWILWKQKSIRSQIYRSSFAYCYRDCPWFRARSDRTTTHREACHWHHQSGGGYQRKCSSTAGAHDLRQRAWICNDIDGAGEISKGVGAVDEIEDVARGCCSNTLKMLNEVRRSTCLIINRLLQLVQAYRLRDKAISSLADAFISAAGAASDKDDPGALWPAFPDDSSRLQSIHLWHLNVHEHQIVGAAFHGNQSFEAIVYCIGIIPQRL